MKFDSYQKKSYIAVPPHETVQDEIANWAVGLSEEVGEVNNVIKHFLWNGETIDKAKVAEECGDILWYLSAMCTVLGIDFDTVAKLNITKLLNRYPTGEFDHGRSSMRKQLDKQFYQSEQYQKLLSKLEVKDGYNLSR